MVVPQITTTTVIHCRFCHHHLVYHITRYVYSQPQSEGLPSPLPIVTIVLFYCDMGAKAELLTTTIHHEQQSLALPRSFSITSLRAHGFSSVTVARALPSSTATISNSSMIVHGHCPELHREPSSPPSPPLLAAPPSPLQSNSTASFLAVIGPP